MSAPNNKDDPPTLDRRDALAALGMMGPAFLVACSSSRSIAAPMDAAAMVCSEFPDETAGPYPDQNGMISDATYEREDITEGRPGTAVSLMLRVFHVGSECTPIQGARVILWQCDANGVYSEFGGDTNSDPMFGDLGSAATTFLRGWQVSDDVGAVTFKTIFPGWYGSRAAHIHVMVYKPSDLFKPVKTTQIAFPDSVSAAVYAQASRYPKGQNPTTNAKDSAFGTDYEPLVASVTGGPSAGYTALVALALASY